MTRKKTIGAALPLAALGMFLICTSAALAQQPSGNAANGKGLYFKYGCYSCHGYNGSVRPDANLTKPEGFMSNETVFIRFLRMRADLSPLLPSSEMPNFSKEALSDKDAKDIYAYIRTFPQDAPKVADVPVLKSILDDTVARTEP